MSAISLNRIVLFCILPFGLIAYLAIGIAWLIAWWPIKFFTGKDILADPNPPFAWMDKIWPM